MNVVNLREVDVPGHGGKQLRLTTAEVDGIPKLSVWILPKPEIILDRDTIPEGIVPGTFAGLSCGHGKPGEKWGLNGGQPREMVVTAIDETTRIYIDEDKRAIVVQTADLRAAERELRIARR